MYRKIILILFLSLFTIYCSNTLGSVKRGLTGAKGDSADEFLVKKKEHCLLVELFPIQPTQ